MKAIEEMVKYITNPTVRLMREANRGKAGRCNLAALKYKQRLIVILPLESTGG